MKWDDDERGRMDRLLARGRLSQPEKERMLAAALPAAGASRPRRRWLWLGAAAPALAAAGLVLMVWPRGDGFRAKGTGGGPAVTASCAGGCAVGRTLVYRVEGARELLYLAAYSVDGAGTRTWHFPSGSGELPRVTPAAGAPVLLPRGIRLGTPGGQTLHWLLLRKPLSREAILATPDGAATGGTAELAARGEMGLTVAP